MSQQDVKSLIEITQALVTTLGIIVAGIWTLYNFGLTRVSAPQVKIGLGLKSVIQVGEQRIATFALEVENTGRTKIGKRSAIFAIRPVCVQQNWLSLTLINPPLDYQEEVHEVLVTHTFLDPSEQYHEELGFVATGFDFLQIGVVFVGSKHGQAWESNYLFDVSSVTQRTKAG